MWAWIKSLFGFYDKPIEELTMLPPPVEPTPKEMVFEAPVQTVKKLTVSTGTFRRGQWVMLGDVVGIIAEFKGADIMFHHVDRETGDTIKEEQMSVLRIRPAKISEIPTCRMGISREVAKERGYGD